MAFGNGRSAPGRRRARLKDGAKLEKELAAEMQRCVPIAKCKMKRAVLFIFIVFSGSVTMFSQTHIDACHVYVVDAAKARAGYKSYSERGNVSGLSGSQTVFPEFYPTIGEEELTTKTYPFPGSRLVITASVYYTDESMSSAEGSDSILVGIVISPKPQRDAISSENNAVTEVTESPNPRTVRAKKYMRVNGRLYLVGIECSCNKKAASE